MVKTSRIQLLEMESAASVSRKTSFIHGEQKFFLGYLNSIPLIDLIKLFPFKFKTHSGREIKRLIYLHRYDENIPEEQEIGFLRPKRGYAIYLSKDDADLVPTFDLIIDGKSSRVLSKYTPECSEFNDIENQLRKWSYLHRERLINSLNRTTGILGNTSDLIEKYKDYIHIYQDKDGTLKMKLSSLEPPTILEYIELNFMLRPAVDPNEKLLTSLNVCSYCGNFYFAKSNNSLFCSSSCRGKDYRNKKNLATD